MKKILLVILSFLLFGFVSVFGYSETIIDDQLANCFNPSIPIAVNQSANTGTGNIRFFCVNTYDHAARIYDESGNSIQTYGTGIYNSNTTRWNDYDMRLEMSFNIYNDHYDVIGTIDNNTSTTENTRGGYRIVKNGLIIGNWVAGGGRRILITNGYIYEGSNRRITLSTGDVRIQNHSLELSTGLILYVENVGTTTSMVYYVGAKYYISRIQWNGEDSATITTREIFKDTSIVTAIFPMETLGFPSDLNSYTGTIDKAILNAYQYNDGEGDDAVRYILSLCRENSTFQFTTTENHHYVSLAGDLPSYNITDTLGFYDNKSVLYYDNVYSNGGIVTYLGMKEQPFLPLQFFCKNNYGYTEFSNNVPQSIIYLNNNTSDSYSLIKATLNSGEKDTISTTIGGGPGGSTTQFDPNGSLTDEQVTEGLFDFDIDGDGVVEAWEYVLAPLTFLKNCVDKLLITAQNLRKYLKIMLDVGNIGIISQTYAATGEGVGGEVFFSNLVDSYNGESGNAGFDSTIQKGKQSLYVLFVILIVIVGLVMLKKQ